MPMTAGMTHWPRSRRCALRAHPAKELLVVVDHNRPLYERLRAALPDAAVLQNRERPGLSGGKNTGVAASTGQVVAFLDDDAVADVNWLKCLVDAYTDASVAGVGGRTLPSLGHRAPTRGSRRSSTG